MINNAPTNGAKGKLVWLEKLKSNIEPNSIEEFELYTLITHFSKLNGDVKRQKENDRVILSHIQCKRNLFKKFESQLMSIMTDETQRKIFHLNTEISNTKEKMRGLNLEVGNVQTQIGRLEELKGRRRHEMELVVKKSICCLEDQITELRRILVGKEEMVEKKMHEKLVLVDELEDLKNLLEDWKLQYVEKEAKHKHLLGEVAQIKGKPFMLQQRLSIIEGSIKKREQTLKHRLKVQGKLNSKKNERIRESQKLYEEITYLHKRIAAEEELCSKEIATIDEKKSTLDFLHNQKEIKVMENRRAQKEYLRKRLQYETTCSNHNRIRSEVQKLKMDAATIQKREKFLVSEIETLEENLKKMKFRKIEIVEGFKDSKESLTKMDDDVTVLLNDHILDEKKTKKLKKVVTKVRNELNMLSDRIKNLIKEDKSTLERVNSLNKERNNCQNDIRTKQKLFVNLISELKTISYDIKEHKRILAQMKKEKKVIRQKIKYIEDQKIKFSKIIYDHAYQVRVFRKEKELVNCEIKILTRQALKKEKDLLKLRVKTNSALAYNESLRQKQSKYEEDMETCRDSIDNLRNSIKNLCAEISLNENHVKELKDECDCVLRGKSVHGMELIKNAKLIAMYERNDTSQQILNHGIEELEFKKKTLRELELISRDILTETMIQVRNHPNVKELEEKRKRVEEEFERNKLSLREVEEEFQNPTCFDHMNELKTKFPTKVELKKLIADISGKIRFKKEQLVEKTIIMNELSKCSDKLRKVSINLRNRVTKNLSQGLSDVHFRITKENSKMKSTLSEISIYEATLYTLKTKNGNLKGIAEDLQKTLQGKEGIPTEIIEKFNKMKKMQNLRKQMKKQLEEESQNIKKSTCLVRPNSYIPSVEDALPIPVPYHSWSRPVFPTKTGSNKRFYQKPNELEVIL